MAFQITGSIILSQVDSNRYPSTLPYLSIKDRDENVLFDGKNPDNLLK